MDMTPVTEFEAALVAQNRAEKQLADARLVVELMRYREGDGPTVTHKFAAEQADVEPKTVLRWIRAGKLAGTQSSDRIWQIPKDEWAVFLAEYKKRSL